MKTIGKSRKRSFRTGFIAGLLAGLFASGVMILISTLGSGLSLPEVVGSKLTALMPLAVFAYLDQLIGADAKYYLFYVIFAGQCVVFALSGGLFDVVLNVQGQRGRPQGSPPIRTSTPAPTESVCLPAPCRCATPPHIAFANRAIVAGGVTFCGAKRYD